MRTPASDDGEVDSEAGDLFPRSLSGSPVPPDDLSTVPTSLEGATLQILQSSSVGSDHLSTDDSTEPVSSPQETPQQSGEQAGDSTVSASDDQGVLEKEEMVETGMLRSTMTL